MRLKPYLSTGVLGAVDLSSILFKQHSEQV